MNKKEINFKESIERIEEITNIIEEGDCELEHMIKLYEEGKNLVNICEEKLVKTKIKINQINSEEKEKENKNKEKKGD